MFRSLHSRPLVLRRFAFCGAVLVTLLASLTSRMPPPGVAERDKLGHVVAYGVDSALAAVAFPSRSGFSAALVGLFAMGGGLELIQGTLPKRESSWADMGANCLGLCAGALLRVFRKRSASD